MSAEQSDLVSLFEAAIAIESAEQRAAFLDESCGENAELRRQVEQLLQSDGDAGSFLERPPAELDGTVLTDSAEDNLAAALEAGLAPTFDEDKAVVLGSAGHSVLKLMGNTIDVPHVVLRAPDGEGADPIERPHSPEIPKTPADSRYRLDGEIARGGMGAIIKGRDNDLGRDLAIKVLLDEHKTKPEVIQRFVEEAQIGGQLQHPGVAPIYELGQFADRRPFFSMKLVKGQTLSKLLADRESPAEDRGRFLGIFEHVCQTMAYAHSRGVIHRDLKPSNIMVGAFGEVQVMDWGLAKVLPAGGVADEKTARNTHMEKSIIQTLRSAGSDTPGTFGSSGSQTQMGSVLGTPAYMPPEQALGEIDNMDERADVFGLGAILCETLTGKPPYVADDGTQVYRLASRGKLADCFERLDACGADDELIQLTKDCLELEPADRPRDGGVLAQRFCCYLESVETKLRETELERAAEAARVVEQQKRLQVTRVLAASVLLVLTCGIAGTAWQARRAEQARVAEAGRAESERLAREGEASQRRVAEIASGEAQKQAHIALEQAELLAQEDYVNRVNRAYREVQDNNIRLAEDLLHGCPSERRGWEWHYVKRLAHLDRITLEGGSMSVDAIAFGPDGTWVVTGAGAPRYFGFQTNPNVCLWDAATGTKLRTLAGLSSRRVTGVAVDPAGTKIAACGGPEVIVWDTSTGETLWTKSEPAGPDRRSAMSVSFTPDGQSLVVGYGAYAGQQRGYVKVWDVTTGNEVYQFPGPNGGVNMLAIHPDGKRLAVAGSDVVELWDLNARTKQAELGGHERWVFCVAFSPDGKKLATGGWDRTIRIWDEDGSLERVLYGHEGFVTGLAFSSDGITLASSSEDRSIRLWNCSTGQLAATVHGHESFVQTVAFASGGREFASGGDDGVFKIWDLHTCTPVVFEGHRAWVVNLAIRRDGMRVYSEAGQFRRPHDTPLVWDPSTGQEDEAFAGADRARLADDFISGVNPGSLIAISPDGQLVAEAARIGDSNPGFGSDTIVVRERVSQEIRFKLVGHSRETACLLFSPDGTRLVSASDDRTIKLWDMSTGREVFTLRGHAGGLRSLAISPDGNWIVSGAIDGTARVWNATPLPPHVIAEQDARLREKQSHAQAL